MDSMESPLIVPFPRNKGKQRSIDVEQDKQKLLFHPTLLEPRSFNSSTFSTFLSNSGHHQHHQQQRDISIKAFSPISKSDINLRTSRRRRSNSKIRLNPILLLFSSLFLLPSSIKAINVTLPTEGFVQCESAVTYFTAEGRVLVDVRYTDDLSQVFNETIPEGQSYWNWTAVNLEAGTPFILFLTDELTRSTYDPANSVFRAPYAQSLSHATVLPNPTNDTACLKTRTKHRWEPKHGSGIEAPVIAGVLGGLLFFFVALVLWMCWRRRSEKNGSVVGYENDGTNHQAGGGNGNAGWNYMANLVPGLTPSTNNNGNSLNTSGNGRRRRRGIRTRRRQSEQDVELPSYGQSQKDAKGPPKYLHEFEDDTFVEEDEDHREDRVAAEGEVSVYAMLARPSPPQPTRSREWQSQESTPRRAPSTRISDNQHHPHANLPRSSSAVFVGDGNVGVRDSDPFEFEYDLPSPSRSNYQLRDSRFQNQEIESHHYLDQHHHDLHDLHQANDVANDSTAALVPGNSRGSDSNQFRSSSPDQMNDRRSLLNKTNSNGRDRRWPDSPPRNIANPLESLDAAGNEGGSQRDGRSRIVYPHRNSPGETPRHYGSSQSQRGGYL